MNTLIAVIAVSFLPFFEARNKVANFVVDPPKKGEETAGAKLPSLVVMETCPACEGKKTLTLVEPDYGQAKGRIGSGRTLRRDCPICRAKGKIRAYMNPNDLSRQISADRSAFAAAHQGRGEIAVGEAFVPNDRYATLDKDRIKLVDNAFGRPCKACKWTGIEACAKCKGFGVVKCANSDCKGGWSVVKTTTESSVSKSGSSAYGRHCGGFYSSGSRTKRHKDTKISVTPCPDCNGARFTICPECGGMRAHPCRKCGGIGMKPKDQP